MGRSVPRYRPRSAVCPIHDFGAAACWWSVNALRNKAGPPQQALMFKEGALCSRSPLPESHGAGAGDVGRREFHIRRVFPVATSLASWPYHAASALHVTKSSQAASEACKVAFALSHPQTGTWQPFAHPGSCIYQKGHPLRVIFMRAALFSRPFSKNSPFPLSHFSPSRVNNLNQTTPLRISAVHNGHRMAEP